MYIYTNYTTNHRNSKDPLLCFISSIDIKLLRLSFNHHNLRHWCWFQHGELDDDDELSYVRANVFLPLRQYQSWESPCLLLPARRCNLEDLQAYLLWQDSSVEQWVITQMKLASSVTNCIMFFLMAIVLYSQ